MTERVAIKKKSSKIRKPLYTKHQCLLSVSFLNKTNLVPRLLIHFLTINGTIILSSGHKNVRPPINFILLVKQQLAPDRCIVVNRLHINQTKTKQTNPFPRSDESLMSSVNSIWERVVRNQILPHRTSFFLNIKFSLSFKGLVWFVWFYGISTFVGYLTPNPFLCK